MTSPLIPVGVATLGTLALQKLRQLNPGDFLRELRGDPEAPVATESDPKATEPTLDLSHAIPAFMENLRQRLPLTADDAQQPLVLKDDGWGGVVVDGDHPDRIAIEELFASDQTLRDEFQQIASAATAERNKSLIRNSSFGEFRLQITGNSAGVSFE